MAFNCPACHDPKCSTKFERIVQTLVPLALCREAHTSHCVCGKHPRSLSFDALQKIWYAGHHG